MLITNQKSYLWVLFLQAIMKLKLAVASVLLFSFSFLIKGQIEDSDGLSNIKTALIIDSLENLIPTLPNNEVLDIKFELAILYRGINPDQSVNYSNEYITETDTNGSAIKRSKIFGLLAEIYESRMQSDSALYYYNAQEKLLVNSLSERKENLRNSYFGSDNDKDGLFEGWIPNAEYYIIGLLLLVSVVLVIILSISKRNFLKIESVKNQELEVANTRFKEFNEKLEQAVEKNTKERSKELEKTNNTIIELRKSLKKAEESNYLKNAFLGTMSHQIRTPLSGIMGFSDMLETELALRGNEELYEFAKNIQEAGEKLMSLITNIIDISSIEANILELNISPCDINGIIKNIEKNYELKAKEKNLIFKTKFETGLPTVEADDENLTKVLKIIIDNAIQFTDKGFVTISTSWDQQKGIANIEIKDKGVGIDDETMKMLLDSFDYSKHGSSLTYKGHGLGLILAHRLITLMNGNLELASKLNDGTSVKISLQCTPKPGVAESTHKKTKPRASIVNAPEYGRIKIFIVEDDRMNRLVLEKMLKNTGDVVTTPDGNSALKYLKSKAVSKDPFDVMLLDINLPSPWDGISLMKEIRKQFPDTKNTPFIAQTAYAMAGDKDHYLDAGFNDYISKPINKTELLTMIQKQLEIFKKTTK